MRKLDFIRGAIALVLFCGGPITSDGWMHRCAAIEEPGMEALGFSPFRPEAAAAQNVGHWSPGDPLTVLDIIVLYTPRALLAHGDERSLQEGIEAMIASANRNFTNSLVGVRLNPVMIGLHGTWVESGDMISDLNALLADSRIQKWRNDYKADLAYLIIETDKNGYGGAATMLGNPAGNPNRSLCIYRRTAIRGNPTWSDYDGLGFMHETGHMLGAGHDREHGFGTAFQGQAPVFSYGNGYRFEATGVTYRTAMGYDPGVQIPLFSNPNLTFDGVPMGVAPGEPGEADNAQTLNRMAPLVAAYRVAQSRIDFAATTFYARESDSSVKVTLSRQGDLSTATAVAMTFDASSTAANILDYTRPSSTLVQFAAGQSTAELILPIVQDDLLEGDETIVLGLGSPQGQHGLNRNNSAVVTVRDDEAAVSAGQSELTLVEGTAGEITFEFTGPLSEGVSTNLNVTVEAGEADLAITEPQLSFTADNRFRSIQLTALHDESAEADEIVTIKAGDAKVKVRILDVSRPGSLGGAAVPNGPLTFVRALPEGGVLAGGDFTEIAGMPRTALAKFKADGSLDETFSPPILRNSPINLPGLPPARVLSATPMAGGGWLVGGIIGLADGQPAKNLIRIQRDGTLDRSFSNPGFDGMVWTIVEAPDGRILIGGVFDHVGRNNIRSFVRLNSDGTIDNTFKLTPGMGGDVVGVSGIGLLPDGRILVAGRITKYNGTTISHLLRLHPDGSLDETFPLLRTGASTPPDCIAILPDGRAYVGGFFDRIGGLNYQHLARLNADGSVDQSFKAPQPNGEVLDLAALPNGQILVGGSFTSIAGTERRFVALLNEDGTLAPEFDPGIGGGDQTWTLCAGGDGMLTMGGSFQSFNRQSARHLARVRLPVIAGAFLRPEKTLANSFQAPIIGLPGATYAVEWTDDFAEWQSAGEVRIDRHDGRAAFTMGSEGPAKYLRLNAAGKQAR